MSGRLVILRHKRWNVWNQDNQEKVLRDERLHKEKEEKSQLEQKRLLQEQQRQALLQNATSSHIIDSESEILPTENINFFKDVETEINNKTLNSILPKENEEYRTERDAKEYKKRKQEGVAPWSLSEGISDVKPWYTQLPPSHLSSSEDTRILDKQIRSRKERDHLRLKKQDPLNSFTDFTRINSDNYSKQGNTHVNDESMKKTNLSNKLSNHSITYTVESSNLKNIISSSNSSNAKPIIKSTTGHNTLTASNSSLSSELTPVVQVDNNLMAQLRQKRLEREKQDKHKASVMLAEIDVKKTMTFKHMKTTYL